MIFVPKINRLVGLICMLLLAATPHSLIYAQLQLLPAAPGNIELTPRYPSPHQRFTARYTNYEQAGGYSLQWFVNNTRVPGAENLSTISLDAPALGNSLTIEVRARSSSGATQTERMVVTPAAADIIIEGDSETPDFYKGKGVPSRGSALRIVAIPHLFTETGKRVPAEDIMFTWKVDNAVMRTGLGSTILEFTPPAYGGETILLTLAAGDNRFEAAATLTYAEPTLAFYTLNPLTGMSRNAIRDKHLTANTPEVSLRVEPYFLSSRTHESAEYGWTINNNPVASGNQDPHVITLRSTEGAGLATIGFSVRNLSALSQFASDLLQLEFK